METLSAYTCHATSQGMKPFLPSWSCAVLASFLLKRPPFCSVNAIDLVGGRRVLGLVRGEVGCHRCLGVLDDAKVSATSVSLWFAPLAKAGAIHMGLLVRLDTP